jgi:hypothetical protein
MLPYYFEEKSLKGTTQRWPRLSAKYKMNILPLLLILDIFEYKTKTLTIGNPINPLNLENTVEVVWLHGPWRLPMS